jgi:uncharacterized DUF497 family protein
VKNQSNKRDHGLSFETAQRVFDDNLALSRPDPHPDGDRWQTIGQIGGLTLFVVHPWPDPDETGRIISARKATPYERSSYEEGDA